jgi:hypothetical protein
VPEEATDNPMRRERLRHGNPVGDPDTAPRCGARTRSGALCQQAAVRGGQRCRMHGGTSTGPRTPEGLARMRASKTTHGLRTKEMLELGRAIRRLNAMTEKV